MRRLIALTALFLLGAQPVLAGTWQALPTGVERDCDFRFSGRIEPGDLTGYIETIEASGHILPRLCLDSEGGSLAEVYGFIGRMAQSDEVMAFSTRIERGAQCLSSCAILFMFGQTYGANSPYPMRIMEPGARLAFHSPFIAPGREAGVDPADAFRVALDVSKLLVDSAYRALTTEGPAIRPEVVALILGTPPDEMYFVDTIGELNLLGIEIDSPEQRLVLPDDTGAFGEATNRICAASHVLTNRQAFVSEGYDFADLVAAAREFERDGAEIHRLSLQPPEQFRSARIIASASGPYHVPLWFSAGAALFCQVEFSVEPVAEGFRVSHYNVGFGAPSFDLNARLAQPDEITQYGLSVGLLPIDQPYR